MEKNIYCKTSHGVGYFTCPNCKKKNHCKTYSINSGLWPHFYCNKCPNVYWARELKYRHHADSEHEACQKLAQEKNILKKILASLPSCPCGGRFTRFSNLRCTKCKAALTDRKEGMDVSSLLGEPQVFLSNNACLCEKSNAAEVQEQIQIVGRSKFVLLWLRAKFKACIVRKNR